MDVQLISSLVLVILTCASFSQVKIVAAIADDAEDDLIKAAGCTFSVSEHYTLSGHNDMSMGSRALQQCLELCAINVGCLSVTRNNDNGNCFISYSSRFNYPDDYRPHVRKNYYHKEDCNGNDEEASGAPETPCIQESGPFGGYGGRRFSDKKLFMVNLGRISKIHIQHGDSIDCIRVFYGRKEEAISGPCHGGEGGTKEIIRLKKHEYITKIEGKTGHVIDNLKFITNLNSYGPYGGEGDKYFTAIAPGRGLAYISGSSGQLLDELIFHFYC